MIVAQNLLPYGDMKAEGIVRLDENAQEQQEEKPYELFRKVSGAGVIDERKMREVFREVPTGLSGIETAHAIRKALIAQGFQYDDNTFLLKDIRRRKAGNCLGLSLLIGAELIERGFSPEFTLISRPKDAIAKKEQELFDRLSTSGVLNYDRPRLPEHQADHPIYRFGPLSHPVIFLDGRPFETTELDDADTSPEWTPESEAADSLTYKNLVGTIYSEQAKRLHPTSPSDCRKAISLARKSLELWPQNADAFFTIWKNASAIGDDDAAKEAAEHCLANMNASSGAQWGRYCITKDPRFLNQALEQYPSFIFPFVEKHVALEKDDREARFNFAVAAWCAGNSSLFSLTDFYQEYESELERLFGAETAKRLTK